MTADHVADFLSERYGLLVAAAMPVSLCRSDAEDAAQMAAEIMLRHAERLDPERVHAWVFVVSRREALRIRALRSRTSEIPDYHTGSDDPVAEVLANTDFARAFSALKPHERLALSARGMGFGRAELARLFGWTHTKADRCLKEGRAQLRAALA